MRMRIRILLPVIQVIIAACLMLSNFRRPNPSWDDPAWVQPDWQLCLGLNAPAFFVAERVNGFLCRWLSDRYALLLTVETAIRLSFIWLIWYAVAVEIGGGGQSVVTAKTRYRALADGLAMAFGAVVVISASSPVDRLGDGYAKLMFIPYILWTLAIVGFYGRDLWLSFGSARKSESS